MHHMRRSLMHPSGSGAGSKIRNDRFIDTDTDSDPDADKTLESSNLWGSSENHILPL